MKKLILCLVLALGCEQSAAPVSKPTAADSVSTGDPIPPCTVYDLHCKNITQPGTGLQLVKCVRTSDPGCPVYSYMVVQPNEWQETCLHVNLDGSGETWYGPCDQ
jgi:hypothetical protein